MNATADDSVRSERHRSSVHLLRDAEDTHLTSSGTCQEHVAVDQGEVIGTNKTRVRQLNWLAGKEVLHGADVEGKLVDRHLVVVGGDERVSWVLGVNRSVKITPLEDRERSLGDAGMDRLAILNFPDDEGIILANAREELVVRGELQFQNLILDATKDCHRFASRNVPQNDWCIRHSLEHSTLLACSDNVSRVGNGKGRDFHVMTSEEFLIVLVLQVFDNKKSADVVEQGVLHGRVELHRVWVLAVVAEGMIHLDHLLLTFLS